MLFNPIDPTTKIELTHVEVVNTEKASSCTCVPKTCGKPADISKMFDNIKQLDQNHFFDGSVLGLLSRNFVATMKLSINAFKFLPATITARVVQGPSYTIVFKLLGAVMGTTLYVGSLLTSLTMKALIWIPVILTSAAGAGLIGAICYLASGGKEESAKKGFKSGARLFGGLTGGPALLIAGLTAAIRGPLNFLGWFGLFLLEGEVRHNKDKQESADIRSIILSAALYESAGDSYAMWRGGENNTIKDIGIDSGESPGGSTLIDKPNSIRNIEALIAAGANVYGKDGTGEYNLRPYEEDPSWLAQNKGTRPKFLVISDWLKESNIDSILPPEVSDPH